MRVSDAGNAGIFSVCDKPSKDILPFVRNFPERLQDAIKRAGLSKGSLARHLGVPKSSVSRWLAGSEPRGEKLSEIAKFLSVDVKWLLEGEAAESSANPKDRLIPKDDEFSSVVREDPAKYGAAVVPRDARIRDAFAEIRRGLDALEELMRTPKI